MHDGSYMASGHPSRQKDQKAMEDLHTWNWTSLVHLRQKVRVFFNNWLGLIHLPANIWFTAATPGRAWWSRMTAIPASFNWPRPRCYKWEVVGDIFDGYRNMGSSPVAIFLLWGRIQWPCLPKVQLSNIPAEPMHHYSKRNGSMKVTNQHTGMRTVLIPAYTSLSTCSWVNQVSLITNKYNCCTARGSILPMFFEFCVSSVRIGLHKCALNIVTQKSR